jgi:hypothetical protein
MSRKARPALQIAHMTSQVDPSARARVFLLSPAWCGGRRARILQNRAAEFDLAVRLRSREGATLGEVFAFLSGLYFRGKLAYARAYASPPRDAPGVLVITPSDGLRPPAERVDLARLARFAEVPVAADESRYRVPLVRDARALAERLGPEAEVVLLGSVATGKYADLLEDVLGERLVFPADFVGRGDMSRGGLLLRCVDEKRELAYRPLRGAVRHGSRPPKLARRPPAASGKR